MLNIKEKVKARLIAFIRHNVETKSTLYGDSYWYAGQNLWEPTVMLALQDLCKPGSIVFDVGGKRDHPHFLLEQHASDMRCFDFLTSRG